MMRYKVRCMGCGHEFWLSCTYQLETNALTFGDAAVYGQACSCHADLVAVEERWVETPARLA